MNSSWCRVRKIIHVDADCFFAALEVRDTPCLATRPIAVGGASAARGVISTCNYIARQYGVHSAMPTSQALRLCPDLVLRPHRFEVYKTASLAMQRIYQDFTERVEPVSLDEAYLDVTDSQYCRGSATLMAEAIRARVVSEVGITCSAGVAQNKFLAKVASDWQKPNGLTVVKPCQSNAFSLQLPVTKIHGVGKVTAAQLAGAGLYTCADIRALGLEQMIRKFGRFGACLHDRAYGVDHRPVEPFRDRQSVGVEHTFDRDLSRAECLSRLNELVQQLAPRIAKAKVAAKIIKLFVKVKFADFTSTTVERRCTVVDDSGYVQLAREAVARSNLSIRLLGVGVRVAKDSAGVQLSLF